MDNALSRFKDALLEMKRGSRNGRSKPHKPVMLLVVLDLIETGIVSGNRIYFDDRLVDLFRTYFDVVAQPGDWCQPGPPFFHLRSSCFWHHHPLAGREEAYAALTTTGGGSKWIMDNIAYAYLDDEVFQLLADRHCRLDIRGFIIDQFFEGSQQHELRGLSSA